MTRKLNNWSYQDVTDFLKENGFSFFEELNGRQAWIKLEEGNGPDRIVEFTFRVDKYSSRTMKRIFRQSGIPESNWINWAGS